MCSLAGGLARLTHLQHLDLNFTPWEFRTERTLLHDIFKSMTRLTFLDIGRCMYATPAAALLLSLTQLNSLHAVVYFDYATGVRQLSNALGKLTKLTALTIQLDALQPSVTDEACYNCVADAVTNLISLEQLGVAVLPRVVMPWHRRAFPDALETLRTLRCLSLATAGDVIPMIELLPSVPSCSHLTKLLVKMRELKAGEAWMSLRSVLAQMPELIELHALSSPPCAPNADQAGEQNHSTQQVAPALSQLTCLVVDMEWVHGSSEHIAGFLSVLGAPSILRTLEISFNDCVDNAAAVMQLMTVLPCAVSLQQLHLKHAQMSEDNVQMFALCCANITELTRLRLHEVLADNAYEHLVELFTAFGHLRSLHSLALLAEGLDEGNRHRVTVCAATALREAVKSMPRLHVLNIKGVQFPNGSLEALAPAFPCCRKLDRLRLRHCFLSGPDVRQVLPALEATPWLKMLDLSYNCINDSGMAQLVGAAPIHLFACRLLFFVFRTSKSASMCVKRSEIRDATVKGNALVFQ